MFNLFRSLFRPKGDRARFRRAALPLRLEILEDRCLMTAVRTLSGFSAHVLPPSVNASTGVVPLGFNVDFGGTVYNQVFVNDNGTVSFTGPQDAPTPTPLASS